MSSLDMFLERRYDRNEYNCAHFVADVWLHLTDDDISNSLIGFLKPAGLRHASMAIRRSFVRQPKPVNPCIILMQRRHTEPHVGVFIHGRVLHICERSVQYAPVDVVVRGFDKYGFYTCKN